MERGSSAVTLATAGVGLERVDDLWGEIFDSLFKTPRIAVDVVQGREPEGKKRTVKEGLKESSSL